MGIKECLNHGLLHPYPVLYEKSGELVAQFKATVLLMPNGSDRCVSTMRQEDILMCRNHCIFLWELQHVAGVQHRCLGSTPTRSYKYLMNDITHRHVANMLNGPDAAYINAPKLLAPKTVFCAESQVPHCKISSLRSRSQTKMSRQYWPLASSPKRRTRRRRRPRLRMVSVSRRQKSDFHCCIQLMAFAQTHLVCSDVALVAHCQRAQYRGPWLGTATVLTVQRI